MHLVSPGDRHGTALDESADDHINHLIGINLYRVGWINRDYLLPRASRTCDCCGVTMRDGDDDYVTWPITTLGALNFDRAQRWPQRGMAQGSQSCCHREI
jgi:hypothetical protein